MELSKIEELEKFERLVRNYVAPNYFPRPFYPIDNLMEKFMDDKILYYLKLGLTSADMKKKIEERNKRRKACEEEEERERKNRKTPVVIEKVPERKKTFFERIFN